jgi:hypothetical protein
MQLLLLLLPQLLLSHSGSCGLLFLRAQLGRGKELALAFAQLPLEFRVGILEAGIGEYLALELFDFFRFAPAVFGVLRGLSLSKQNKTHTKTLRQK